MTRPVEGMYDLVLMVGNTLSLFEKDADVERAFGSAASALVASGVLLAHVIDFEYVRTHDVSLSREAVLDGCPTRFGKRIVPVDGGAMIEVALARRVAGQCRDETGRQLLHERSDAELADAAYRHGLSRADTYGGMDGRPMRRGATRDVVLTFTRVASRRDA
jgi:hypothetical protein